MEIVNDWRVIPFAPDYSVNQFGDIMSFKSKSKKLLKKTIALDNYVSYSLRCNGKYIKKRAHQIVAVCFIDNPLGLNEINHLDANKSNNHYTNLEWCTHTENIRHSFRLGLVGRKSGVDFHKYDKGKKVIDNSTGVVYNSVAGAARSLGLFRTSLNCMLSGSRENKTSLQYL
jgi:hypothetical protein